MADSTGLARVYDLRSFTDRRGRTCAICGTAVRPQALWADLEGRVWDICRPCGDEATHAAVR